MYVSLHVFPMGKHVCIYVYTHAMLCLNVHMLIYTSRKYHGFIYPRDEDGERGQGTPGVKMVYNEFSSVVL